MGGLEETVGGRFAVDGVDHDLLGLDGVEGVEPGADETVAGVVDTFALVFAAHKHGLDDEMAVEGLHAVDNKADVVGTYWAVHLINL